MFDACIYWFTKFENGRTLVLRCEVLTLSFLSFSFVCVGGWVGRGKGSYGAIKKVEEGGKNIIMKKCLKRQIKLAFFFFHFF